MTNAENNAPAGQDLSAESARIATAIRNDDLLAFEDAVHACENAPKVVDENAVLHFAAGEKRGEHAFVTRLVQLGADVEARSSFDETPLLRAVSKDSERGVRSLLNCGADASAQLPNGFCAYHMLAPDTPPEIPKLLYRHGLNPQTPNNDGLTATEHFETQAKGFVTEAFDAWCERQDAVALPIQAGKPAKKILVAGGLFSRDDVTLASWKRLPELLHKAKKEKQQLEPEGVAQMLSTASAHGLFKQAITTLNHNGFQLAAKTLFDAEGKGPSALLEQLVEHQELPYLFTQANMQGQLAGMMKAYQTLPETARSQVGNIHQLRARCENVNPEMGR